MCKYASNLARFAASWSWLIGSVPAVQGLVPSHGMPFVRPLVAPGPVQVREKVRFGREINSGAGLHNVYRTAGAK
jgi:hypothetical protein